MVLSLSQHTYKQLRARILNNQLRPGRRYLEKELTGELKVSRTPLREALVKLENEGLIKVEPRHGMQVQPISAQAMEEIYQVVTCLECEAVATIANRGLTDKQIKQLESTGNKMQHALDNDNLEAWANADEQFHRLLLEFSGNERLKQTVLNFWDLSHRTRYFTLHLREKPVHSTKDHQQVIEAIKHRDASRAVDIHKRHRIKGGLELVSIIRQFRLEHV